jgi:hypothetical protein
MAERNKRLIPTGRLRELFDYDPLGGELYWSSSASPSLRGRLAGSLGKGGYRSVTFDGVSYLAHRLIWAWVYGYNPTGEVDHVGQERLKVKRNNVQGLADRTPRAHRRETSLNLGARELPLGVHATTSGSYTAIISVDGKQVNLGSYPDPQEASAAFKGASKVISALSL